MWAQLTPLLKEQARRLVGWLGLAAMHLARAIVVAWRLARPSLVFALNVLVALLLLFEEWGWRPLSNLLAQLARFRIWAMAELWIAGLPPYGALVTLAVPSMIIIPAKLIGVYLLATGHIMTAAVLILCAKLAGTALVARIFLLTKPALMQIAWFQRAYDFFVPWQEALFGWIRGSWVWRYGRIVKWRVGGYLRRTLKGTRPRVDDAWSRLLPRAIALRRRLGVGVRDVWRRTSLAGERLLRRLQRP